MASIYDRSHKFTDAVAHPMTFAAHHSRRRQRSESLVSLQRSGWERGPIDQTLGERLDEVYQVVRVPDGPKRARDADFALGIILFNAAAQRENVVAELVANVLGKSFEEPYRANP